MELSSVRTHQIARYWYCAEQSRLMVVEGLKMPRTVVLDQGTKIHGWLEKRPKTPAEVSLHLRLKEMEPLTREIDGAQVIAHPDDVVLLGKNRVQLIEYKTIEKTNVRMWKSSLAKYQLRIYCWVLEPILWNLGLQLVHFNYVVYLTRQGVFLKRNLVEKDNYCTERMIRQVLDFWKTGEPLTAPMKWKCKMCPDVFRERCRLRSCSR